MVGPKRRTASKPGGPPGRAPYANQFLTLLPRSALDALAPALERVPLEAGDTLFEPGDEVSHVHFPLDSTVIALVLPMHDGRVAEAGTIGREGAVGGVVSLGLKPAFCRASVQIGGDALRASLRRLEAIKRASPKVHDLFTRYADCLTAQVLQAAACAALHPLEARYARWLLLTHDRLQRPELPLTQEALAEMLGVARTYVTRIASELMAAGAISYSRGIIRIESRPKLQAHACECYATVRQHFDRVAPGLYPRPEP